MSPAAVKFESPVTVKPTSSVQNPNRPSCSSSNDLPQNQPCSSTNCNSESEFGIGTGIGIGNGNGYSSHTGSRFGAGRGKPRMTKVRKQVWRPKTEGVETGLGFNPFRSVGEDSCPVNNDSVLLSNNNGVLENSNRVNKEDSVLNDIPIVKNENLGSVSGSHECDEFEVDSNSGKFGEYHSAESEVKSVSDHMSEMTMKRECEAKPEKLENMGFVFGPDMNNVAVDMETSQTNECAVKLGSDDEEKINLENGEERGNDSSVTCRVGANGNECLNVNLEEGESSESVKKPVFGDIGILFGVDQSDSGSSSNSETSQCNRSLNDSGLGFVFGASWCSSASNSNLGENDSGESSGKSASEVESETESQKVEVTELRFNYKSKFVSESFNSNIASASSPEQVFKLPDEMKKLNINEFGNGHGADKKNDSNKDSCAIADTSFVFCSSTKPSSSTEASSDPTHEQISGPSAAERLARDNFGTSYNGNIIFGSSCNIDSASFGSSSSEPFAFKAALGSQPTDHVSEAPSMVGVQKKDEGNVTSTPHGIGVSFTEFTSPNWDPSCFKENLYPGLSKNLEFSVKSRSKKTRGKLKQHYLHKQVHVPKQSSPEENQNSPNCYSPMDFSPCMGTTVGDQPSRETSMTPNESFHLDNKCAPSTSHPVTTDSKDENLSTEEESDNNIGDQICREPNEESSRYRHESYVDGDCPPKWFVFGADTAYYSFNQEQVCSSGAAVVTSAKDGDGLNMETHESLKHCFPLGVENQKYFTFSALSSAEGCSTLRKHQLRKKSKKKVGNDSFVITPSPNVKVISSAVQFPPPASSSAHGQEEDKCTSQSKVGNKSEATAAFQDACEMWRLRGNQAYRSGNLSEAEEFYARGINCVPLSETAGCCIKPLVLCYSNRAAARISLGKMREAIEDCVMAAAVDPKFLKVYVRAANCHLVLGEIENARRYCNKVLESGADLCLDRRITIDAADCLQKAQKVAESTNRAAKILEQKTSEAASSALGIIVEALLISSRSEMLLEMKAEALCMLRKYEEAIQLCEQTLHVAEENFASTGTDNCSVSMNASGIVSYSLARLWRWHLISKSYFCMGRLEDALDLLQKLEQVGSIRDKYGSDILESSISLAATIRELLHRKNAGNDAVRTGRYTEAVEHYTFALSSNVESRPFAAICFCNRAAAHQALGHIADAIADCSLAMALDGNYTKAVSRRAVLHETIRDYAQAASDLERLVSILEKSKRPGSSGRSNGGKEIRQAQRHMSLMEEEAKKGLPLEFYIILGVKATDAASDIKKAYRKAALRHHPDKVGQFLPRTEGGDEGRLWKEIVHDVQKDADRLFKMIGEAYAILSDTSKRSDYDIEEEIRKVQKERYQSSPYGRQSDSYSYSAQRSATRQNWQDSWRTYGYSQSRW